MYNIDSKHSFRSSMHNYMYVHMQLVYVNIHYYVGMKRNLRRMLNIIIFRVDINISQFNIILIHFYIHMLQRCMLI